MTSEMKRVQQSEVMSLPAEMYKNMEAGTLTITIKPREQTPAQYMEANEGQLSEQLEEKGITENDVVGCFVVDMQIQVGDLKDEQIIGCDPQEFLSNGLVAAILDAIRTGLVSNRGINVTEAVEDASEKARTAVHVQDNIDMLDKLQGLMLAIAPTDGEA